MPTVQFRTRHVVQGSIDWTHDERMVKRPRGPYSFEVDGVTIEVDPIEERVIGLCVAELSQSAVDSLSEWMQTHSLPEAYHPEIARLVARMGGAVRRLVENLCFTYPMDRLLGERFVGAWYSLDGKSWESAQLLDHGLRLGTVSRRRIDDESRSVIQAQLDAGVRPLEAFRHLQRAEDEREPRHSWIDTAIAAELGIKEFLARREPKLVPLLLDVPSPPVARLYGRILEEYDGKPFKWADRLQKCANRRNDLVHKHTAELPTAQEAADYVNLVTAALYDLMACLYPADPTLAELREDKVGMVERVDALEKKLRERAQKAKEERERAEKRQRKTSAPTE